MRTVELGLGLVSIGRRWGVRDVAPPPTEAAIALVEAAHAAGIRFFDTAPAYGDSERVLGLALRHGAIDTKSTIIATKIGEHWNDETGEAYVDHGYDAMMRSLDRSFERLGRIDLLQLHKATAANIEAADVARVFDGARAAGVGRFGASVSDVETARIACRTGRYEFLQFPYNLAVGQLEPVFALLREHGMRAIVNRPFAMGGLATDGVAAFGHVLSADFDGVVLTGTSSLVHLAENIAAFRAAQIATSRRSFP